MPSYASPLPPTSAILLGMFFFAARCLPLLVLSLSLTHPAPATKQGLRRCAAAKVAASTQILTLRPAGHHPCGAARRRLHTSAGRARPRCRRRAAARRRRCRLAAHRPAGFFVVFAGRRFGRRRRQHTTAPAPDADDGKPVRAAGRFRRLRHTASRSGADAAAAAAAAASAAAAGVVVGACCFCPARPGRGRGARGCRVAAARPRAAQQRASAGAGVGGADADGAARRGGGRCRSGGRCGGDGPAAAAARRRAFRLFVVAAAACGPAGRRRAGQGGLSQLVNLNRRRRRITPYPHRPLAPSLPIKRRCEALLTHPHQTTPLNNTPQQTHPSF